MDPFPLPLRFAVARPKVLQTRRSEAEERLCATANRPVKLLLMSRPIASIDVCSLFISDAATARYIQSEPQMSPAFRRAPLTELFLLRRSSSMVSSETCDVASAEGNGSRDSRSVSGLFPCGPEQGNSVRPLFQLFALGNE